VGIISFRSRGVWPAPPPFLCASLRGCGAPGRFLCRSCALRWSTRGPSPFGPRPRRATLRECPGQLSRGPGRASAAPREGAPPSAGAPHTLRTSAYKSEVRSFEDRWQGEWEVMAAWNRVQEQEVEAMLVGV
jgi:hypothetical protein